MSSRRVVTDLLPGIVMVLFTVSFAVLTWWFLSGGSVHLNVDTRTVGAPVCEGVDARGRQFVAETVGTRYTGITEQNESTAGRGVVYRRQANTQSDRDIAGRLLPSSCLFGFVDFCIGEPLGELSDESDTAPLDQRWFVIDLPEGNGYVHGGVVQELPPGTIDQIATPCSPKTRVPGTARLLTEIPAPASAAVTLHVAAADAVTVGAALFAVVNDPRGEWVHIGMDMTASGTHQFKIPWEPTAYAPQEGAILLLSVCWAGNVPATSTAEDMQAQAHVVDIVAETAAGPSSTPELKEGAAVACRATIGGA